MTHETLKNVEFGTCSWNYDSWIGLVYTRKASRAAEYLREYSGKYPTVEIDSWFYKLPSSDDAKEYRSLTPEGFSFSCKVSESVSLPHERNRDKSAPLVANPDFLSPEVFGKYLDATRDLHDRIFLAELEFEYLNKQKIAGVDDFMSALDGFVNALEKIGKRNALPLGIECRNSNYLTREYFQFLKDHDLAHVFSEKQFLPHVYELYAKYGDLIGDRVAIRLLGGDRKEIEEKTKGNWSEIVEPKGDLPEITGMIRDLAKGARLVKVYLNNHYEGSAPKSIERIQNLIT